MIKIGVRAHDYGRDTPDQLFARIHGDGFSSIQLALKKAISEVEEFSDVTPAIINNVIVAAQRYKMHLAVLGVYIEPALVDNELRKKSISEFIKSIPVAKELGADCIATETTSRSLQPEATPKEALVALKRSLWEIMPVAEENNVTVAIEPVASHTVNTPECAASILKTIGSPNLKIVFDPVNLLTAEETPTQNKLWERAFLCFGDKIAAVHVKGVKTDYQNRLVQCGFADSIVNYQNIFSKLKTLPNDFSVLREEIKLADAKADYKFLADLISSN